VNELKLLAIETSSSTGSIALAVGSAVAETTIATPREQTPRILGIVDELLSKAELKLGDLDGLVFGRGPGSFTGLRVAAAVAQGLSFSTGVPIVSVSSLAALAQRGFGRGAERALCCVDARMGEVYWASFDLVNGLACPGAEELIGSPEIVTVPEAPFVALGDGFKAYSDVLSSVIAAAATVDPSIVPSARELLTLGAAEIDAGRIVPLEAALPVYLRQADAWSRN
jgi:tRNA threonylcarbamoyladenosine biosynthesis protein TsaB